MRYVNGVIGCWALLWVGIAPVAVRGLDVVAVEYVGSTPCDAGTREFLGGLGTNAECHYIRWQLTLVTNQDAAPNFALKARYYVAEKGDTNRSTEGPEVNVRGNWDVTGKPGADRVVHRFTAGPSKRSLAFVEVGENSIHLLNGDGTLAIGTGGLELYVTSRGSGGEVGGPGGGEDGAGHVLQDFAAGDWTGGVWGI